MTYKITDQQIETINGWLADAYEEGRIAGFKEGLTEGTNETEPVTDIPSDEPIYKIHNCIVDISSYQATPDYDQFCSQVDFVILRARYCSKTDSKFEERAAEFNKRNMPFAVYDYVTLMSHANAKQQAEKMYELCEPYHPRIYYIDTEQLGTGVQRGEEMSYIQTYVQTLRDLGVKCIGHYTGDWLYSTYYKRLQDLFDTLWIASYGKNTGTYDGVQLASESYTNKIDLHQYTDKGALPGIASRGDRSRLTGKRPLSWFTGRKYEGE